MTLGTGSEVAHIPCPSGSIGDVWITCDGEVHDDFTVFFEDMTHLHFTDYDGETDIVVVRQCTHLRRTRLRRSGGAGCSGHSGWPDEVLPRVAVVPHWARRSGRASRAGRANRARRAGRAGRSGSASAHPTSVRGRSDASRALGARGRVPNALSIRVGG